MNNSIQGKGISGLLGNSFAKFGEASTNAAKASALAEDSFWKFIATLKENADSGFPLAQWANDHIHWMMVNYKYKFRSGKTGKLIISAGSMHPSRFGKDGKLPVGFRNKVSGKVESMNIFIDDPFYKQ